MILMQMSGIDGKNTSSLDIKSACFVNFVLLINIATSYRDFSKIPGHGLPDSHYRLLMLPETRLSVFLLLSRQQASFYISEKGEGEYDK